MTVQVASKCCHLLIDSGATWSIFPAYSCKMCPSQISVLLMASPTSQGLQAPPLLSLRPPNSSLLLQLWPSCSTPLLGRAIIVKLHSSFSFQPTPETFSLFVASEEPPTNTDAPSYPLPAQKYGPLPLPRWPHTPLLLNPTSNLCCSQYHIPPYGNLPHFLGNGILKGTHSPYMTLILTVPQPDQFLTPTLGAQD